MKTATKAKEFASMMINEEVKQLEKTIEEGCETINLIIENKCLLDTSIIVRAYFNNFILKTIF